MEQEKNQVDQNFAKINISPFTTQEVLNQQMEQFLNQEEIQLTIQKRNDCNILFENILQKLKGLNNLNIFKLNLLNFRSIDFDDLFYHISQLSRINELNIRLVKDIQQFKLISHNVGHYLSQLKNLQILSLQINLKKLQHSELTFNLHETYQNCSKLKRLDFTIQNCNHRICIFDSLLDGIRLAENLEELSIYIFGSLIIISLFNKLYQEIKNLKNIKSLDLYFSWTYGVVFQEFQNLLKSLSKIQSLENLKISMTLNNQEGKNDNQYNDLKQIMSSFQNLKKFIFNLCYCKNINIVKLLDSIASLPNVEETTIDLYVNQTSSFENNLPNLTKALCSIQSLISLDIYFSSIIEINLEEFMNLIEQIKNLKKLKKLNLYSKANKNQKIISQLNLEDFTQTVKKLEKFDFSLTENQSEINIENQILNSLSNPLLLKELHVFFGSDFTSAQNSNQKELILKDILQDKSQLEKIRFNFNKAYVFNQQDISYFFKSFKANQQIKFIEFKFPKQTEYDFLFLDSLSQGLSYLSNLSHLFLDFNRIDQNFDDTGLLQLSSTIGKIDKIQYLNLVFQCDYLQSITLKHILSQFKNMVNLRQFVFEIQTKLCHKDSIEVKNIYDTFELPKSIELMSLLLDDGDQNFAKIKNIFENIKNLKNLFSLNLHFGKFLMNQNEWVMVRSYLAQLKLVQRICLQLYDMQQIYLISLFEDLPYLKKLELREYNYQKNYYRINIKRKFTHKFDQIYKNKIINYNGLQQNQISEFIVFENQNLFLEHDQDIKWSFQSLKILTHFDITIPKNPNSDEKFICDLFESMKSMNKLVEFKLNVKQNSNFANQSLIKFGELLPYLTELKYLKIEIQQQDNLKWQDGKYFLQGIKQLKGLQDLNINIENEKQNSQIFDVLNECVEELNLLKSLSLKIQILRSEILQVVPKLQKLFNILKNQLKYLSLQNIEFSYSEYKTFSKYLKNLKNLTYIKIDKTPKQEIYKLPRLVILKCF
ncbi:hypothetical protein ABPG72_017282 [Tetrahymena utriculariae]